ncbi:hypothetical protein VB713_19840 [Anabaena cylindrica UHCC 0172]|nr:hypothetical protein [Anabaena cylindrica]MEA5553196.1 hypothetical protein [Anabaena cylindrica UHCC 0172]
MTVVIISYFSAFPNFTSDQQVGQKIFTYFHESVGKSLELVDTSAKNIT